MPLSAMPEHLNTQEKIDKAFPDDEQYGTKSLFGRLYRAFNKKTKTWFAFSYRCTEWWAKWRKYPMVLFAVGGEGEWRLEVENDTDITFDSSVILGKQFTMAYLSRVQYYKRWHFAIQWPLMFSFHFYLKAKDVPKPFARPDLDGKVLFAYWNHYDADNIYWMITSAYVGLNWK